MTKENPLPPDFDALAKRYLDLWQDQIAKLAKDPAKMTDAATAWSQMASSFMKGAPTPPASRSPASHQTSAPAHDSASSTDRTPPASASHGDGGVDLVELVRKLDELDRRLTALEALPPGPASGKGPGAARGGRGSRTKS